MRKNALSGEVQTRSNDETLNKRHLHILPLAPPGEDAPAVAGRDACATGRDKMASMSEFSPPWWLRNAHAQTVWGRLARSRQLVRFRREVLRTPDDDDLIGEHPGQTLLSAAATVSVPYDLGAGSRYLEIGAGRWYVASFLSTLKRKLKDVVRRSPETARLVDVDAALRARTFRELDDSATAPLHGMKDADDYYDRASSIHYLDRITTPTLCVSAEDDPF